MTKLIAFFDIDGTLNRSSLLIELFHGLVRMGVFPPLAEQEITGYLRSWNERRNDRAYVEYIMEVVGVFYRRVVGVSVHDVEAVGRMIAEEQHHRVYVYTRTRIEELRASHHLVAISGSPDVVVGPFAHAWGFDRVYCSKLEQDERAWRYTGNRMFGGQLEHKIDLSNEKRLLLAQACEELGATLDGSVGVGDTESDIGFLDAVAQPVAFNPNAELFVVAQQRGWPIVIERKNVIVQLHNGSYDFLS